MRTATSSQGVECMAGNNPHYHALLHSPQVLIWIKIPMVTFRIHQLRNNHHVRNMVEKPHLQDFMLLVTQSTHDTSSPTNITFLVLLE